MCLSRLLKSVRWIECCTCEKSGYHHDLEMNIHAQSVWKQIVWIVWVNVVFVMRCIVQLIAIVLKEDVDAVKHHFVSMPKNGDG